MKNKELLHVFNSGAELIYQKNNVTKSTALKICFACGSRCDGEVYGLSHFCEHMFFTGTKTENKQQISKQYFDFIDVNAFTNAQEISFLGEVFTSELKNYLALVAKLITKSTFSPENVEEEKKVVLQEIVQDSDDYNRNAIRHFSYLLFDKIFYDKGVLGNKKSVSMITSDMVKNYVKKYFVANNCKIFIVSPLGFDEIVSLVEKEFLSKLKINKNLEILPYDAYQIVDKSLIDIKKDKINKNFLHLGIKTNISRNDLKKLSYTWAISDIMSNYSDGLLKTLRLEKGLVYSASIYFDDNKSDGELIFKTELEKTNIKPCIDCFASYIKEIKTKGIDQYLIDKKIKENNYYLETSVNSAKSILRELETYNRYGKVFRIEEMFRYQKNMTKSKLDNIIKELFDSPKIICSVYGDASKDDVYTIKEIQNLLN